MPSRKGRRGGRKAKTAHASGAKPEASTTGGPGAGTSDAGAPYSGPAVLTLRQRIEANWPAAADMHAAADRKREEQSTRLQYRRATAAVQQLDQVISYEPLWGRASLSKGDPIRQTMAALKQVEATQPQFHGIDQDLSPERRVGRFLHWLGVWGFKELPGKPIRIVRSRRKGFGLRILGRAREAETVLRIPQTIVLSMLQVNEGPVGRLQKIDAQLKGAARPFQLALHLGHLAMQCAALPEELKNLEPATEPEPVRAPEPKPGGRGAADPSDPPAAKVDDRDVDTLDQELVQAWRQAYASAGADQLHPEMQHWRPYLALLPVGGVGNLLDWSEATWSVLAKADPAGHMQAARYLRSFLKNYCAHYSVHASEKALSLTSIGKRIAQTVAQQAAAGLPEDKRLALPQGVSPDGTVDPTALRGAREARPSIQAALAFPLLRWALVHVMSRHNSAPLKMLTVALDADGRVITKTKAQVEEEAKQKESASEARAGASPGESGEENEQGKAGGTKQAAAEQDLELGGTRPPLLVSPEYYEAHECLIPLWDLQNHEEGYMSTVPDVAEEEEIRMGRDEEEWERKNLEEMLKEAEEGAGVTAGADAGASKEVKEGDAGEAVSASAGDPGEKEREGQTAASTAASSSNKGGEGVEKKAGVVSIDELPGAVTTSVLAERVGLAARAMRDFAPGDELVMDYGPRPSIQLLHFMGFAARQGPWSTVQVPVEAMHSAAAFVRKQDAQRAAEAEGGGEEGAGGEGDDEDARARRMKKALTNAVKDPLRPVRTKVLHLAKLTDPAGPGADGIEFVALPATGYMSAQALGYCRVLAADGEQLRQLLAEVGPRAKQAAIAAREVVEGNRAVVRPVRQVSVELEQDEGAEEEGPMVLRCDEYPRNEWLGRAPRLRATTKAPALPPPPPTAEIVDRLCPVPRLCSALERRALRIMARAAAQHRIKAAKAARELHGASGGSGAGAGTAAAEGGTDGAQAETGAGAGAGAGTSSKAGGAAEKSRGGRRGGRGGKRSGASSAAAAAASGASSGAGTSGKGASHEGAEAAAAELGRRAVVGFLIRTMENLKAVESTIREWVGRLDLEEEGDGAGGEAASAAAGGAGK